jgi:surfactin synthase thioesterase subunit
VRRTKAPQAASATAETPAIDPLAKLSPEKRQLLALRLRAAVPRTGPWFPSIQGAAQAKLRLFCFPYAGGGASMFRGWAEHLPPGVAVLPARLPGRETRLGEPPFDLMEQLIEALREAIAPYLDQPFAFLGHSLGAVIAFELARTLPDPPACLLVSGARAPQLRRDHVPPPPQELLDNKELMQLALPALRADTALYRNYIYTEGPPLACDIRAYGGAADERITRWHLETWAEQTTKSFAVEMFPGSHFFLNTNRAEFLAVLSRDLRESGNV